MLIETIQLVRSYIISCPLHRSPNPPGSHLRPSSHKTKNHPQGMAFLFWWVGRGCSLACCLHASSSLTLFGTSSSAVPRRSAARRTLRVLICGRQATKQKTIRKGWRFCFGGSAGIRTRDQRIKSPLLYRLSYRPGEAGELYRLDDFRQGC